MSWYEFLLTVHVALAAIWVGSAFAMQLFGIRALASTRERLAGFAGDVEWIGMYVLVPVSLLALVSGILLVIETPFGFGDDWVVIALVLYAITFVAGAAFFGPESGRIGKLVAEHGADAPEPARRIRRILVLSRLDLVLLFGMLYVMAVKPDFGSAGSIAWGAAGVAVAAAAVLWRALGSGAFSGEAAAE